MSFQFPKVGEIFEERYELLEILGSGGIGIVYKALQTDAGRVVAIKMLQQRLSQDETVKRRFVREAQVLNKLKHENIVTVYHLGETNSSMLYLVMEYIEGVSLRSLLVAEKRLSAPRTVRICLQLCAALSHMHQCGYLHRDLKPDNIVLLKTPEPDTVKIIDFGLARLETYEPETRDQKVTDTGVVIGSLQYMSPEQYFGPKVDARSDLYSLVLCFYEMLSGQRPFQADSPVAVMYKQAANDYVALSADKLDSFHPFMNEILARGLNRDLDKRHQNAGELAEDLRILQEDLEAGGARASLSKPAFIGAVAVFLLLIAAVVSLYKENNKAEIDKSEKGKKAERTQVAELASKNEGRAGAGKTGEKNKSGSSEQKAIVGSPYKMRAAQLKELIAQEAPESFHRAELLLELIKKVDGLEAIRVGEESLEICRKTEHKTKDWTRLYWRSFYELMSAYEKQGLNEKALPMAMKLMEEAEKQKLCDNGSLKIQELLRAKVIYARNLASSGKKEESLKQLKEIAQHHYGFWRNNLCDSIALSIDLGDLKIARSLGQNLEIPSDAVDMAELCRKRGLNDLAHEFIQDCLQQSNFASMDDFLSYLVSKNDRKGAMLLQKENYIYYKQKKETELARKCLNDLRLNPAYEDWRANYKYLDEIKEDLSQESPKRSKRSKRSKKSRK